MKKRIIQSVTWSIVIMLLCGILGMIASPIVLAWGEYKCDSTWVASSHGSPPDGTLRNSVRESYRNQIIYEHYSWYGDKPSVTRGIVGFRDMISEACHMTGWFVGTCLACFYLLIQVVKEIKAWRSTQEVTVDRAYAYWN